MNKINLIFSLAILTGSFPVMANIKCELTPRVGAQAIAMERNGNAFTKQISIGGKSLIYTVRLDSGTAVNVNVKENGVFTLVVQAALDSDGSITVQQKDAGGNNSFIECYTE